MRSASATKKNTSSFKAIITRHHCSVYISSPFHKRLERGSRLYTHIEQHYSLSKYMEKPTKPLESKLYKPKKNFWSYYINIPISMIWVKITAHTHTHTSIWIFPNHYKTIQNDSIFTFKFEWKFIPHDDKCHYLLVHHVSRTCCVGSLC